MLSTSFALAPEATATQASIEGTGRMLLIYLPLSDTPVFYRLLREE